MIDARIDTPPMISGYTATRVGSAKVRTPSSMTATAVTAYVSNRSAAMPAQSPTLSPTLSAMTAGLRGSSSGMPASTLPTRSAPTSAPLVKMPPPSRAQIFGGREPGAQDEVVDAGAENSEPDHQQPGHRPRLEGDVEPGAQAAARGLRGAHIGAHRHVHADI